jgi:AcrR family transcriptional regulator
MSSSPVLTRAERQARTRAALLDAAHELIVERGYAGASVVAIAERAGFTRGAFYSNFTSKEELFAALLQERVFALYRAMGERDAPRRTLREVGERTAEITLDPAGRPLFTLWLELLLVAGRDPEFRRIAAEFWSRTREVGARSIGGALAATGRRPPADPRTLATAFIALDIGLALQNWVDPEAVTAGHYPELYELLFSPLLRG